MSVIIRATQLLLLAKRDQIACGPKPNHYIRVGHAKVEVIGRSPLTEGAWVQSQAVCEGCLVGRVALVRGVSRGISVVSCQLTAIR